MNQQPPGYPPGQPPQQVQPLQPQQVQQQMQQQPTELQQAQASQQPFGQPNGIPQQQQQAPGTQPPPQQPTGPATIHMPTAEVVQAGIARAQEIQKAILIGSQGKKKFFDVMGPNDQPWKHAYPGYVGKRAIYLCPSWAEGSGVFIERVKRFWKSHNHPQGRSVYAGDDSIIAKAVSLAYQQGFNKDGLFLKRNRQFIWQGFAIEVDPNTQSLYPNPTAHVDEQGVLKPMLFQASLTTHNKILQEINVVGKGDDTAGFLQCLHPETGRPFLITKTKTGPESRDVTYGISRLEPTPLPQEYQVGLHNLWALDDLFPEATPQEQVAAIIDAGLPLPPEAAAFMPQAQPQVGYQGQVPAPTGYPQQQNLQPVQQQIPQGMPQPAVSYQQQAAPPVQNPFQGQPIGTAQPAQQQPIPLPQAPQTGMAAAAPPPPPMPTPQGLPPPPGATAAPPPPPEQAPPPPPPAQAQLPAQQSPPTQAPGALTPEQLQAQFQGGKAQF